MKIMSAFLVMLLFAGALLADSPPTFPVTFYGYINTTSNTPIGQTLTAVLGTSTKAVVVATTSLYSCGAMT